MAERITVKLPGLPPFGAVSMSHWEYRPGMRVVAMDYAPFSRRRYRLGTVRSVSEVDRLVPLAVPAVIEVLCDDGAVLQTGASWLYMLDGTEPLQLAGGQSLVEAHHAALCS